MKNIFHLSGWFPSEFRGEQEYLEIFAKHGLMAGRMISGSKSGYWEDHKDNVVVFNANIVTKRGGKVWYGDIDATISFDALKEVADELQEDLYVLREMDARFDNENKGFKFWKEKAVTIIKCKE